MAGILLDQPWWTGFVDSGAPAAGYWLFSYAAGTTTKINTYTDIGLTTPNANPIVLNSAGRAVIFLTPALPYKFVLAPAGADPPTSPVVTQDNVIPYAASDVTANAQSDIIGTAGENLSIRSAVYMSDGLDGRTAGRWYLADASFDARSVNVREIGVVPNTILNGAQGSIRIVGKLDGYTALGAGAKLWVGTTPGSIVTSPPMRAVPIGVAESATTIVLGQWSGSITPQQYQDQLNMQNLVVNGDLRQWNEPSSGGPSLWTFAGAGGSIVRTGSGEADTFSFFAGRYAAKMTRAGTNVTLTQTVLDATRYPYFQRIEGKQITFMCLARTAVASQLRLAVFDGINTTVSAFHTGGGSTEVLQVTSDTVSSSGTTIEVRAESLVNGDCYVGGFVLLDGVIPNTRGTLPPSDWHLGPDRLPPGRVVYSNVTDIGNVGGGTDDLHSVTLSPDTIRGVGDELVVKAAFITANNANAKTLTFVWNGVTIITANLVVNSAAPATAEVHIVSTGLNTQFVWGWIAHGTGTTPYFVANHATGAATETGTIVAKFQGAATTDNDIVEKNIIVERWTMGRNLG